MEKNCHLLIEAYEKIETGAKLAFAGSAKASDAQARESRRHVSERIGFLDYVSGDERDELLTTILFVLPSDREGVSLALLEAMGAGRCVLVSDIPENQELVDGVGFTFQAGDVADLERMLGLLIADSAVRIDAGRRAKKAYSRPLLLDEDYLAD